MLKFNQHNVITNLFLNELTDKNAISTFNSLNLEDNQPLLTNLKTTNNLPVTYTVKYKTDNLFADVNFTVIAQLDDIIDYKQKSKRSNVKYGIFVHFIYNDKPYKYYGLIAKNSSIVKLTPLLNIDKEISVDLNYEPIALCHFILQETCLKASNSPSNCFDINVKPKEEVHPFAQATREFIDARLKFLQMAHEHIDTLQEISDFVSLSPGDIASLYRISNKPAKPVSHPVSIRGQTIG